MVGTARTPGCPFGHYPRAPTADSVAMPPPLSDRAALDLFYHDRRVAEQSGRVVDKRPLTGGQGALRYRLQ